MICTKEVLNETPSRSSSLSAEKVEEENSFVMIVSANLDCSGVQ